jgi:hypothetical protein
MIFETMIAEEAVDWRNALFVGRNPMAVITGQSKKSLAFT